MTITDFKKWAITAFCLAAAGQAGLAHAMNFKVSDDRGAAIATLARGDRNRVCALGPSSTMRVFARGPLVGLLNASYLWEFGARTSFEGKVFFVGFNLAKLKSLP